MQSLWQWSTRTARDYEVLKATDFASLNRGPLPGRGAQPFDGQDKLYAHGVGIQGIGFEGWDHYHILPLLNNGTRLTIWNDDPDDRELLDFHAEVWEIYPLAPNATQGGAYNTRQRLTVYAHEGSAWWLFYQNTRTAWGPVTLKRWEEFTPPADPIHGIWTPDDMDAELCGVRSKWTWRDFTEGVPQSELQESGKLGCQRDVGRYVIPEGTRTYYLTNTNSAQAAHTATEEKGLSQTTATQGTIVLSITKTSAGGRTVCWGNLGPVIADWPSGVYNCQYDVASFDGTWSHGLRTITGVAGHFAVVDTLGSADRETKEQAQSASTGTGLIAVDTGTWNPASGNIADNYEALLVCYHTAGHGGGDHVLTLNANDADTYADGPWPQYTVTFDADVEAYAGERKTVTFDADVITTSGATYTVTFDADTHLVDRDTEAFDADVRVADRKTEAFDADTYLVERLTEEFLADVRVAERKTEAFDADVIAVDRSTVEFDADTIVGQFILPFDADVHLVTRSTEGFDADTHLVDRNTETFDADTVLFLQPTVGFDADTHLVDRNTEAFDADVRVTEQKTVAFDADTIAVTRSTEGFDADTHLVDRNTESFDADVIISGVTEYTISFDADTRVADRKTEAFDADVRVADRKTEAFDADTHLVERNTEAFDADVIAVVRSLAEFLADVLVVERKTAAFDADTFLVDRFTEEFDADTYLVDRFTEDFPADTTVRDPLMQRPMQDGSTQEFALVGAPTHVEAVQEFPAEFSLDEYVGLEVVDGPEGQVGKIEQFLVDNIPGPQQRGTVVEIEVYARAAYDGANNGSNVTVFWFQIRRDGLHVSPQIDLMDPDTQQNDVEKSYVFSLKDPTDPSSYFTWADLVNLPVEIAGTIFISGPGTLGMWFYTTWSQVRRWQELEPTQYPLPAYATIGVYSISFFADTHLVDRNTATFDADVIVGAPGLPSSFVLQKAAILFPTVSNAAAMRTNVLSNAAIMHPVISREGKGVQ
jgi:hypothetical protein